MITLPVRSGISSTLNLVLGGKLSLMNENKIPMVIFVVKEYSGFPGFIVYGLCHLKFCLVKEINFEVPAKHASRFHTIRLPMPRHMASATELTRHGKVASLTSFGLASKLLRQNL